MNRILNAAKFFITGAVLCGLILIGGKASAEEVNQEAIEIFRETVLQTAGEDTRVFHQDIFFVIPRFTGELEFLGSTEKDTFNLAGQFEMWMVDDNGNDEHIEKPFYLTQDNDNMVVYFQDDKKWKKMTAPTAAATLTDTLTTPNSQELETIMEFVKDVTILQDDNLKRTLLVKIDGVKIADFVKAEMEKDAQTQPQDEISKSIVNYIDTGLRNSDVWYTWTVDKTNWQTVTMSFNLGSLVQNIAFTALNDTSQPLTSLVPIREILENVAFYSEFKSYTTFLNPEAKARLEIPKKVLKAKEVESFTEVKKSKK